MRYAVTSGIALLALAGCASKPENISPAFISEVKYDDWDCASLAAERGRYDDALAQASTQQRKARSSDTLGVIFLGLPVSTLAGNNAAGEISRLKGEVEALARAQGKKNCYSRGSTVAAATTKPMATTNAAPTALANMTMFGVKGSTVTKASAVASFMADPHGVMVAEVAKGSPAERAGLVKGDIIQTVNNLRVSTPEDFDLYMANVTSESGATLGVWRDRQIFEIAANP